jgi:hypothetical protein
MRNTVALLVAVAICCGANAQAPADPLDDAISVIRAAAKADTIHEQSQDEAQQFERACQTLIAAGARGADRLETELAATTGSSIHDDVFRAMACAALYDAAGPEKAGEIARSWSLIDRRARLEMTFYVAFKAATSQDPRVAPMLRACISDEKGTVVVPVQGLTLAWPRTAEVLWGSCGPGCADELKLMLRQSADPVEIATAVAALAKSMDEGFLPDFRALARGGNRAARIQAILALGWYGHPDDFEFLRSGLRSKEPDLLFAHIFALIEYGDLRATRDIMRHLSSRDLNVRSEAAAACLLLPTSRSLERVARLSQSAQAEATPGLKERFDAVMEGMGTDGKAFLAMPSAERERLIGRAVREAEAAYRLKTGEEPFTRERLMKELEDCAAAGKITGWVDPRQILSVATPRDIPLLLELRAQIYPRLTDQAFQDVGVVDQIIRRLGRSRYRKEVGVTGATGVPHR